MTLLSPNWLWALLLLPVLVAMAVLWERDRARAGRAFAETAILAVGTDARARAYRRVALGLAIVAAAMGPVALAGPAVDVTEEKQQGAVMVAVDTSKSMTKTDLAPSRLDAAKEAATRFLDAAPDETLVGLITFSDRARVQVAPTTDRLSVRSALDRLETREGTALGSAVVAGLGSLAGAGVLEPLPSSPRASAGRILILTDGAGNVGITPEDATERAKAKRVPLYTVMLGNDLGRPELPSPATTPASMATQTGGIFAQTTTTEDLVKILEGMGGALAPVQTMRQLTVLAPLIALTLLSGAGTLVLLGRRRPVATGPGAGGTRASPS